MTRSITPLKKRTTNPPPKMHRFFRGEKQRATRSKARRVTHHKEDKTRNTRTCLVITLQCANAEALWAIMDCILFLFVCVFEVILGRKCAWVGFQSKTLNLILSCVPPLNSRGRSGECIYTGSSVKKTKEEEKKKKSPPKRLMCVNIYISLYLFLSRINNTRLSSRSRSFIFILLLFFSVVWAMFF